MIIKLVHMKFKERVYLEEPQFLCDKNETTILPKELMVTSEGHDIVIPAGGGREALRFTNLCAAYWAVRCPMYNEAEQLQGLSPKEVMEVLHTLHIPERSFGERNEIFRKLYRNFIVDSPLIIFAEKEELVETFPNRLIVPFCEEYNSIDIPIPVQLSIMMEVRWDSITNDYDRNPEKKFELLSRIKDDDERKKITHFVIDPKAWFSFDIAAPDVAKIIKATLEEAARHNDSENLDEVDFSVGYPAPYNYDERIKYEWMKHPATWEYEELPDEEKEDWSAEQ